MERAFKVISEMYEKGILKDYAICGTIAVMQYTEPFETDDMDIFFTPQEENKIILLTPFYDFLLRKKGYIAEGTHIIIGDMPIQFVPATTELEKEAVKNAIDVNYKEIKIKILRPEYLIAIYLWVYRKEDIGKIIRLLNQARINNKLLIDILKRHNLYKKYLEFEKKFYE